MELKVRRQNRCAHTSEYTDQEADDSPPVASAYTSLRTSSHINGVADADIPATGPYSHPTGIGYQSKSPTTDRDDDLDTLKHKTTKLSNEATYHGHETSKPYLATASVIAGSETLKPDPIETSTESTTKSTVGPTDVTTTKNSSETTATGESNPTTPSTTSSSSTTSSMTSAASPLSTFPSCPYYDGYCLGAATTLPPLIYIRCGRSLSGDATMAPDCVSRPDLIYEGSCNQACFNDPACKAWSGSYQVPGVGFPNGTYACCHVYENITLRADVPPVVRGPLSPFSGSSYGVRGVCPLGATDLCPYYDGQCVEGVRIHCHGSIETDAASDTGATLGGGNSQFDCHQSCVEDPTCTAWSGFDDFIDTEVGGGITFICYHHTLPIVLKPGIGGGGLTRGYGVKGC
ncbi:hypothetical protein TruAng_004372 [Truncatella angustata]|nr:hypothetical protein TruAng_004372 [Truncatella angustata]